MMNRQEGKNNEKTQDLQKVYGPLYEYDVKTSQYLSI